MTTRTIYDALGDMTTAAVEAILDGGRDIGTCAWCDRPLRLPTAAEAADHEPGRHGYLRELDGQSHYARCPGWQAEHPYHLTACIEPGCGRMAFQGLERCPDHHTPPADRVYPWER